MWHRQMNVVMPPASDVRANRVNACQVPNTMGSIANAPKTTSSFIQTPEQLPTAHTDPCPPLSLLSTTSSGLCCPCRGFWQHPLTSAGSAPSTEAPLWPCLLLSVPLKASLACPTFCATPHPHEASCSKYSLYCVLTHLPPSLTWLSENRGCVICFCVSST